MNYEQLIMNHEPLTINNGLRSIKNEQLCKTNPISEKPKINLNYYKTKYYENKSGLLTMEKQTQTNPILPATPFGGFIRLRRIQKGYITACRNH